MPQQGISLPSPLGEGLGVRPVGVEVSLFIYSLKILCTQNSIFSEP